MLSTILQSALTVLASPLSGTTLFSVHPFAARTPHWLTPIEKDGLDRVV